MDLRTAILVSLLASLPLLVACDGKRDFQKPSQKAHQGGVLDVVPYAGFVVCTEPRMDIDRTQRIDLVAGAILPGVDAPETIASKLVHLGTAGAAQELSWKRMTSTSSGDVYEFTLKQSLGQANEHTETQQVVYSGYPQAVFAYGSHTISLSPVGEPVPQTTQK
ncbi:MAG: hypothetical protein H6830_09710 [Planctomycetes bacterium]|nr:hypothetical protein [Planctomycetota bacterium]MCB9910001.1 hypothetical protein [Planctomycetota bacterium]HPF14768.1 hypothetical protein [Planctomycetota bacterium]HRV80259.1 hypothetical protein [Planctomycetota bacterium]